MNTREFADWVVETAEDLKCSDQLSPTGFALTKDGKITVVHPGAGPGDDPVEMLFAGLRARRGDLFAVAVALDVVVGDPQTGDRRDAILVHVEDSSGAMRVTELYDEDDEDIEFDDPHKQRCEPRIFEALELKHRGGMPAPDASWYDAYLSNTIPGSNRSDVAQMMRERQLPPSSTH